MFQQELAQAAQRVTVDSQSNFESGQGSLYNGSGLAGMPSMSQKPPGLEKFSHEQILKFAEMLQSGNIPPELSSMLGGAGVDANGKPIIDAEGGCVIQPQKGFVVKTKAPNVGKVFVNMCQHELIDPFEVKAIPAEDQTKMLDFAKEKDVALVVIGPEAPLVAGEWVKMRADF